MPSVRLLTAGQVDGWQSELAAAMAAATAEMHTSVGQALSSNGLTWASPAGVTAMLWDQTAWVHAVEKHLAPVANRVAAAQVRSMRAKVTKSAAWGALPDPAPAAQIAINRAIQGGPWIGSRIGLTAAGGNMKAISNALDRAQATLDPIQNPTHYGGIANPNAARSVADEFAIRLDTLGDLTARSAGPMANYATANLAAATTQAAGVTLTWNSAFTPTTRDDHADADGQSVPAGSPFDIGGEELMYPGDPSGSEANTCNSFGPTTRLSGLATALMRAPYRGVLLDVVTADGQHLSATPDHPVLTRSGWRPVGSLKPGDDVLCCTESGAVARTAPDVEHREPTAEEAFRAANLSRTCTEGVAHLVVDLNPEDAYGEIEVQWPDGPLTLGRHAEKLEQLGHLLVPVSEGEVRVAGHPSAMFRVDPGGTKDSFFVQGSDRDVQIEQAGADDLAAYSQLAGDVVHRPEFVFVEAPNPCVVSGSSICGGRPGSDTHVDQTRVDQVVADSERSAEGSGGLALLVASNDLLADGVTLPIPVGMPPGFQFSSVTGISSSWHVGHVYDITTPAGLLSAGGIVAHNCLCWTTADGLDLEDGADVDSA